MKIEKEVRKERIIKREYEMYGDRAKRNTLPIIYNVNFGHSAPMCVLPYGATTILDLENKKNNYIRLLRLISENQGFFSLN